MLNFQSDTPRNSRQTPRKKRTSAPVGEILQYTPPQLRENAAGIYVEFYAYDPSLMRMRRKTIKLNRVKGTLRRRQYAREIIGRLNNELQHGWNPWIEKDTGTMYLFEEAADRYETHLERMYEGGYFRKDTYAGYKSYLKILRHYIEKECPIRYVYQFDRRFCTDFLDYVFIIRGNGAQTRNNYLHFLRLFSTFLVEKSYLNSKPTECITPISKRLYKKERTSIPLEKIGKMGAYLRHADPDFLLACYLLYYCFIRPVEMTRLRISDINLAEGTITIPADASKNRTRQTVTAPHKVLLYALDRGLFDAPGDCFIFSEGLRPGRTQIDPKKFRDHWEKMRRALRFKKEWKFYSLKDTGITAMIDGKKLSNKAIRDQARHSSLAITDLYVDHGDGADADIAVLDGAL